MAAQYTRYGRKIRPTEKVRDTEWRHCLSEGQPASDYVAIDMPDDQMTSYPTERVKSEMTSSLQNIDLQRAEMHLKHETKRAQIENEEIELQQRKIDVKKRLQQAQSDYDMKNLEIKSNKGSMITLDKCSITDSLGDASNAAATAKWLDNCRDNNFIQSLPTRCRPKRHETSAQATRQNLPKLKLEVFSGKPVDWPEWFLSYQNLIHENPTLSDGQKLSYLKMHLGPEPRSKVFGLLLNAEDYSYAMRELENRYGNPALVIEGFIKEVRRWPKMSSVGELGNFFTKVSQLVQMFRAMGYEADLRAQGLLFDMTSKIPDSMQESWGVYVVEHGEGFPTVELFYQWLREKESALRFTTLYKDPSESNSKSKSEKVGVKTAKLQTKPVKASCSFCNGTHWLDNCPAFLQKLPADRLKWFKETGRCFLCAKTSHRSGGCLLKARCKVTNCGRAHSTLLHDALSVQRDSAGQNSAGPTKVNVGLVRNSGSVYLQILPVRVHAPNGRVVDTYALLDSGSQTTLVQESFANNIGLNGPKTKLCVSGINNQSAEHSSKRLSFWLSDPHCDSEPLVKVSEAWSFSEPFNFPPQDLPDLNWPHVQDLNVRQVHPSEIMILIGANVVSAHRQLEIREGHQNLPIAVRTPLGWTIMGVDCSEQENGSESVHFSVNYVNARSADIERSVERFWKTESFGSVDNNVTNHSPYSMEDKRAKEILDSTVRHTENGHYEVAMLWSNSPKLVNNRKLAEQRFKHLKRKLNKNPSMRERYKSVVNDYINKGFARKLSPEEATRSSDRTYYLPHHGVINPKKPEKLRVVFDAAAVYDGSSLNHHLLAGPDLLNCLIGVLLRFRGGPIAISADIESMFHMVLVPSDDQDALRFLWQDDLESERSPDVYQMVVHIFGAKSSPCCANYCLRRCALDHTQEFSDQAINTVLRNFYVDDMLKSVDGVQAAIGLAFELIDLLGVGGFKLTKWVSNSQEVLDALKRLDPKLGISTVVNLDLDDKANFCRTLGMKCDMSRDTFCFDTVVVDKACTKREILSKISSVYDPLGLLAPFVLRAKLIMKGLWEKGYGWDARVDDEDLGCWMQWCSELNELPKLSIHRCYWPSACEPKTFELHTFCDASERAFAACSYLVTISDTGERHVSLVMSKSRVSPLKQQCLTLPRLELQGAVLAIRLCKTVLAEIDLDIPAFFFWTDSSIVLQYISSESKRLKTFVANRVSEIRSSSDPAQWRFVPGVSNPADDCSRGLEISKLTTEHRWFRGPEFLCTGEWPVQERVEELQPNDVEMKRDISVMTSTVVTEPLLRVSDFSKLSRVLRVTAWCLRFCHNVKEKKQRVVGNLTVSELNQALTHLVKEAQSEYFAKELVAIRSGSDLPRGSSLKALTPIFVEGVLRVGGRLEQARIPYNSKHQVIIPRQHPLADLLALDAHCKVNHAGQEHTIAVLRERFWIPQVRSCVKKVIQSCRVCHKRRVNARVPRMAQLPVARVEMNSVWAATGCDYFGPIMIKRGRGREKRWVCLLTSLTVRAIHLELASSLNSDAFILALRRFIARRGKPKKIFSDNGTNFVGASRELKEALASLDSVKVHDNLAERGIEWHFNPPSAPHMGGVWERLVRSVKRTLDVVLKGHCVHEDTLHTFLCEVEAILNSRPLTPVSSSPHDLEALTPSHFLLGVPNNAHEIVESRESDLCSRKRWRQSQVLLDHFWRRWRREYLPSLTISQKWTEENPSLKVDDVVLLSDSNEPRGQWPLARVVEVCPGPDGRVRVVKVLTKNGVLTRPVAKLRLLEESKK